jgi:hypothetical protein
MELNFFLTIGVTCSSSSMTRSPKIQFEQRIVYDQHDDTSLMFSILKEFCYGVYNQCESFIWLDLMVKT